MPILFTAKPAKKGKQEQIERVYRLPFQLSEDGHCSPIIREQTSFDLDKVRIATASGLSQDESRLRKYGTVGSA
jgi:hypothetical protein